MILITDIPNSSVFAFIDELSKRVHVSYSSDSKVVIARAIRDLELGVHPVLELNGAVKTLKLVILEGCSKEELQFRYNYYVDNYVNSGYTLYGKRKNFGWKVKFKYKIQSSPKIEVQLKNTKGRAIHLGLFESEKEAQDFVLRHYSDKIYRVVRK